MEVVCDNHNIIIQTTQVTIHFFCYFSTCGLNCYEDLKHLDRKYVNIDRKSAIVGLLNLLYHFNWTLDFHINITLYCNAYPLI
jgi:hypothetical protein